MHVLRVAFFDRETSTRDLVLNRAVGYQNGPRSTLDQRVTKLEHKVAELSSVLNGITQQLVDVSSSVHDMALLPRVNDTNELTSETESAEPSLLQQQTKKKTTYIIADADCAPEPQRRLGNDIIIADREL